MSQKIDKLLQDRQEMVKEKEKTMKKPKIRTPPAKKSKETKD